MNNKNYLLPCSNSRPFCVKVEFMETGTADHAVTKRLPVAENHHVFKTHKQMLSLSSVCVRQHARIIFLNGHVVFLSVL